MATADLSQFEVVLRQWAQGITTKYDALQERVKRLEARSVPARKPESFEEVVEEFKSKGSSYTEAEKFWNWFESVGWKTRGGQPLKSWRHAVAGWIIRNGGKIESVEVRRKPKEGIDFYLRDRGDGVFGRYCLDSEGKRTGKAFNKAVWMVDRGLLP